ncbi:MAG: hypothetical protein JO368_11125 [Acidimicrobiales bacterium]|nr:hypothetical protein [Acidimicrobiales bacterium]
MATRAEGADGERAAALASVFGWLPSVETQPVLRVVFGPELPAVPDRAPDEAYGPAVRVWRAGEVLTVADGGDLVAVATPTDVRVGGAPKKAIRHVALLALGHVLGFHRRFVLHAGVIAREARVALVPGESGRGKSSVVAAARAAGWEALGDDTAILRVDGPTVSVSTLGLPLLFPGDLLPGDLSGSEPVGDDPRARHTFPAPPPRWRGVTDLVVPAHGSGAGELVPLTPLATFEAAVGAFVRASDAELVRRYAPAASALSRLPAWRLAIPAAAPERRAGIGRLLGTVVDNPAAPTAPSEESAAHPAGEPPIPAE